VAPIILTSRSQETETVALFFTADTFDRATPDRLTISLSLGDMFSIRKMVGNKIRQTKKTVVKNKRKPYSQEQY
jgi:hypothetical protein